MKWGLAFLPLMLALVAWAFYAGWVPDRHNPWAPLDLREEPGLVSRYKLYRMQDDRAACLAALEQAEAGFTAVPDRTGGECPLENIVTKAGRGGTGFNQGFTATCGLAAAWEVFRRHTLEPAAMRHFGVGVARVDHVGTFACRNVYGRAEGRRSQHARANAIDIAGFRLADGTRISVLEDWDSQAQPRKAAFLRAVRDGACEAFHIVLGPEYNAAHADHFHFDMGGFLMCR